jgi:hypothetical protein
VVKGGSRLITPWVTFVFVEAQFRRVASNMFTTWEHFHTPNLASEQMNQRLISEFEQIFSEHRIRERHFSLKELGEAWGISDTKVGGCSGASQVWCSSVNHRGRLGRKLKRSYYTMRIPESVAIRVYERMRQK